MKIITYNIQYGMGTASTKGYLNPTTYIREGKHSINNICEFFLQEKPDIIALQEVDSGSIRSRNRNQIDTMAKVLQMKGQMFSCKYKRLLAKMPVLKKQGNAFLSQIDIEQSRTHYLEHGNKRAVLIAQANGITFLTVHLSIRRKVRLKQVFELAEIINDIDGPVIIAGDFNAQPDAKEIQIFLSETKLTHSNQDFTYPSWKPKKKFDYIFTSPEITVKKSRVLDIEHSDHKPLLIEIEHPSLGSA